MDAFAFHPVHGNPFAHLGKAEEVSYDVRAPLDEVRDAGADLVGKYAGAIDAPTLHGLMADYITLQRAEDQGRQLLKAHNAVRVAKGQKPVAVTAEEPKAQVQPFIQTMGAGGDFLPKPDIPFHALKQLRERLEIVKAIHQTRRRQVQAFAQPSTKFDEIGWRIVHADTGRPMGEVDLEAENRYFSWLSGVNLQGGLESDPRKRMRLGRQSFETYLGLLTEDSLSYDHVPVETVAAAGNGVRGLDGWFVRDGATFYLARTFRDADADESFMVQTLLEAGGLSPTSETFTYDEVALFQRNLSSSLESCGYGRSELESSLETLSNFIQAVAFTREGIDNNAIPRGILMLSGAFNPTQRQAFQQAWQARVRGAQNAFTLPVMISNGQQGSAQFVQTGADFSEMHFARWIALQSSICTAVYGMDPREIGLDSFSAEASPLSGSDTAERLAASRDKGLRPFLAAVAGFHSDFILGRFWDKARLRFFGLDSADSAQRAADRASVMTIDEKREALNLPKHPIAWIGALPADAGLLSAEYQRVTQVATLNEGRQMWGLKRHPDPIVGGTPLNPSLGASYQASQMDWEALQEVLAGGDGDGGLDEEGASDAEGGSDDGKPEGSAAGAAPAEAEGSAPAAGGKREAVAARLADLRGGGSDER